MAFTAFRGMNPWSQLIMTAFVSLVSFLALFLLSVIVAVPVFGLTDMLNSLSGANWDDPQAIIILKYLQVVQSLGLFVVPPLIAGWLFDGHIARYLRLNRNVTGKMVMLAVLALLVSGPFVTLVGKWNSQMALPGFMAGIENWMRAMETQAEQLIYRFIQVESVGGLLFNLFMIAVIPAIGEEFLFRGVIQKIFTRITRNNHWGIWLSAFLFSALHMQFFGFVPRLLLGALFGYLLVYSGSLWLPVLCHFLNNAMGVLSLHAASRGHEEVEKYVNFEFDNGSVYLWLLAVVSLFLTYQLLRILKNDGMKKGTIDFDQNPSESGV